MAKLRVTVGYAPSFQETAPGVWEEVVSERVYFGELYRSARRLESSGQVNDDVNISNRIRIVADPYAREHFFSMRYVIFQGAKWKVREVEVQYPGLILTVGGLYHGESTDGTAESA